MQRLAVFSFIGILVLLLASTMSGAAVRKAPKKTGATTRICVTAPVQLASR
ncbi:MAG TPA: hypothetical protein VL832_09135 [Puia sp.]|nr:hypothetical protein [Puia sp.]